MYCWGTSRYHAKAEVRPLADVEPHLNPVEWEAGAGQVGGMLIEHHDKLGPPATDERHHAQVSTWGRSQVEETISWLSAHVQASRAQF